jgi:hypothetical protein
VLFDRFFKNFYLFVVKKRALPRFSGTRQKPVCRRARKILFRRIFVPPAGRSGGFKRTRWDIFASPELSLTPGGRLYTQVEIMFFWFFCGNLGLQETRKILIWGIPVHPAGRSGGFEGIKWGIFAFPELSLTPGDRLYTQVGVIGIMLFSKFCQIAGL